MTDGKCRQLRDMCNCESSFFFRFKVFQTTQTNLKYVFIVKTIYSRPSEGLKHMLRSTPAPRSEELFLFKGYSEAVSVKVSRVTNVAKVKCLTVGGKQAKTK